MNFKKTYVPKEGFTKLCAIGESTMKHLEFGIIELSKNGELTFETEDRETAFIILGGCADFTSDRGTYLNVGKRRTVFEGKAEAVYYGPHAKIRIFTPWKVKIAVCQTPCDEEVESELITQDKVKAVMLGKPTWRRETHFVVGAGNNAKHLCIGEAWCDPGNWAGFPPHKHDTDDMPTEGILDEVYYFLFQPEQGFAVQCTYKDGEFDEAYRVKNNDLVEFPRRYHTTVGAPGYNTYFLWAMAGEHKGFYRSNDPDHDWVSAVENFMTRHQLG